MHFDRPYPPNGAHDTSGLWTNPGSQNPGPLPAQPNDVAWFGEPHVLRWAAGAGQATASVRTATWGTPLFDLRPDLRASQGRVNRGTPVWRGGLGGGGHLWVQITGLNTVAVGATPGLRVRMQEFGHVYDGNAVVSITPNIDVTRSVVHGGQAASVILPIMPPGDGYPVRYWRVTFTFDQTETVTEGDPVFTIFAAYY
jgi:hypothetical protein